MPSLYTVHESDMTVVLLLPWKCCCFF